MFTGRSGNNAQEAVRSRDNLDFISLPWPLLERAELARMQCAKRRESSI
jgi:hypothetical protein